MSSDLNAASQRTAAPVRLESLAEPAKQGANLFSNNLQLISNLKVRVTVSVGTAEISVGELLALKDGSIVKLDANVDDPVELHLDGKLIATGSLVVVEDNFGIRISAIHEQKT